MRRGAPRPLSERRRLLVEAAGVLVLAAALAVGMAALTGTTLADLFRVQCTAEQVAAGCGWGR